MATYRFPSNLSDEKHNYVRFKGYEKKGSGEVVNICLYMPPTVAMSDGASYGSLDLGIIGGGEGGIQGLIDEDGKLDTKGLKQSLDDAANTGNKALDSAVLQKAFSNFGLGGGVGDRVSDLVLQNKSKAINPNTVLQYTNSEIRQHNFTFKMVAESKSDATKIQQIVNSFRKYMYGVKDGITVTYPAEWTINFMAIGGGVNQFIAQPYKCFLESCQATYNTSSGLTHADGSPIEVDVTLAFREIKALQRDEIVALAPNEENQ